ncbi:uncharacterized protein LOC128201692 [Galleria mellonella]|uniref:Uncharacterized protein LOC128201692 n=1 Tax=Galleria mellonella TaxID=7137 RepID=A0ABM3MVU8_GALME|nr:uncharacterized protein LOC128201692 [Galleria mellonella]
MSNEDYFTEAESDNSSSLSELKKQRGTLKGRLTLFEKYLNKLSNVTLSEKQQAELLLRIESVSNLFNSFNEIQEQIEQLCSSSELPKQLEYREYFENLYFDMMSAAKCFIKVDTDKSESSKCSHASISNNSVSVKLPEIRLAVFDGSYDHWLEYKHSYLSMIHKRSDLDAIQKFHYLKSSLRGSALEVISALEFTAVNYTHAWELLESRYHSNRLLIHNHVKSLFTAQSINKESPMQIRKLIDVVLRNLRALKSLDEPTDSWDTLIIYIMVSKLDTSTEREWENHKGTLFSNSQKGKIKLEDLLNFLRNRADMLDMVHNSNSRKPQSHLSNSNKSFDNNNNISRRQTNVIPQVQQSHSFVSTRKYSTSDRPMRQCALCGNMHSLYACIKFLNLPVQERIKFINEKKLCCNCLRSGHSVLECNFGPCKQCQKNHNSLLHNESVYIASTPVSPVTSAHNSQSADKGQVSVVSHAMNFINHAQSSNDKEPSISLSQVLLSTALVEVMDNNNKYHTARALLDSGSHNCFVSSKLCEFLNVSIIQSTIHISGVGHTVSQSNKLCDINMRSKTNEYNTRIKCFILPCITSSLPSTHIDSATLSIPDDICLADPTFNSPSAIDLLIGADVLWDLLDEGRLRLPSGPYLQKSKLGWLLSGPLLIPNNNLHSNKVIQCNFAQMSSLDIQLRKFWELEEVSGSKNLLTEDERQCEESFINTTKRDSNGRFAVRIPLKESADALGDSYEKAKSRFLSLERKLNKSPKYKEMYVNFMREYINLNHMTPIKEYTQPCYFLPHHGVFREHSITTKLRVVFDASATTTTNKSLNDIQRIGPPLQNDIFSILLRFRSYKYVACADVEKMYRQILIQNDQRTLQLILWRENSTDELVVYQLNTVTYGTASAPYLSMRCLRQLAYETTDDVIARVIIEDFFVDDLITGDDDPVILSNICENVSTVLKSGCFPLRKWTFNHDINIKTSKELAIGEYCQNKTLGLGWQVDKDELHFTTSLENKPIITKRTIMSIISQIYDPLGLLSPTIIIAKIMLQKLWLLKIDWDDVVPIDIECQWNQFLNTLSHLPELRIPRYVMSEDKQTCELHIFTDASQDAYGACAYIRTYNSDSDLPITIKLLCAKSKIAPVKTVCTIPRLELCGALLGAWLYHKIINSLRLTFTRIIFWTDSTIVIGWLRMSPYNLKTFVQNRVSQINELTGDAVWLHIDGKSNPADIVSRGLTLNKLKHNELWWHGPLFLRDRNLTYSNNIFIDQTQLPEVKTQHISMVCNELNYNNELVDFNRFSSFNRLRRAGAYVLRFVNNIRVSKLHRTVGPLSTNELNASVIMLTQLAQSQSFSEEYSDLVKRSVVKAKRLIGLNIFVDENKLIRVGGRLRNSPHFDNDKKHPVLLCSKHRLTILLFRYEHIQLLHGGPQLLLACIRESWWPLGGRNLARKTVHDCVTCTRMKGRTFQPLMGDLPAERLEPGFPFMRSGVDYAGPVMILNRRTRGATLSKGYICLFTCLCTRSIHLELVTSLSTNDYILALKRFISRRGKPAEIMSDNGRNFVGAEKELYSSIYDKSKEIKDFSSNNNIKFSFIPPYAPHFGGCWELGVKLCKHYLRRVVGNSNLTYEELSKVLAQIEAILNSRPLTPLSTDPNDLQALTPAHFLIGRPLTAPATRDVTDKPTHRLLRYDVIEQMRQHFWRRWAKEYVSELQSRSKWKTNQSEVELNKLVLIKDDNLPPLQWKLGRIIRIYPGTDGISRVADLLTSSGTTRRAFSKICPLPVEADTAASI